ncbi:MAG: hypothetical protein MJ134_08040 [Lachnospiraceae bacterium]|nr:hypothetical protein [Lachnospiraceae bacterium]
MREGKGSSVPRYLSDYCVLDLETTGVFVTSAEIIEISAIRVRGGNVVAEFSQLVNPGCKIPAAATAVNNITDVMVKDAPLLKEVIDDFLAFVGADVILGYNNAGFDMNLVYDKVMFLRGKAFGNDYIDLMHAARRTLPELENHKLETLSKYYGLDTKGEHRALKDCYLTKDCYEKLNSQFGDAAFRSKSYSEGSRGQHYSSETKALQMLQEFLEEIIADGQVTATEFFSLTHWMTEHRDLQGCFPFDRVFDALDRVLADGKVTPEELLELQDIFSDFVDPVKSQGCHEEVQTLKGKHVCITGDFNLGSRSEVFELIEAAGGIIDKNVKKATDYVVVGANGSDAWKTGNYGGKILKAMEYNAKGTNIKIIEEDVFVPAVQYLIEHPEACECSSEVEQEIDWKTPVQEMLEQMIVDMELPENSLYLMTNYGRDGKKITSYSVCIYEPDYPLPPNAKKDPTRNSIVLNIKEGKEKLELLVGTVQYGDVGNVPEDAEIKQLKSDTANVHVILSMTSGSLVAYIKKNTQYALANYTSKASMFGCCSSFNACSDAKKCVHVNKLYSKACIYRGHLDAGRIFYGKNRNVD